MSGAYDHIVADNSEPRKSRVPTPADMARWNPHDGGVPDQPKNGKGHRKVSQLAEIARPEYQTDLANGERFNARFGDRVRYAPGWNQFVVYAGTHWKPDIEQVQCRRLAAGIARAVWTEVGASGTADAIKFAKRTASRGGISGMIYCAAPSLTIDVSELDADAMLFNCVNCTLDLRTGQAREHRREDLITKVCPTPFDPNATCPTWEATLLDIFNGSKAMVDYMQRLAGWWLTGLIQEHLLHIAYGIGANGKSTLFNTLLDVWGPDYAMQAPPDLLMQKSGDTHPTERADLFGKRLVIATETENNARFAESMVKQLTGGDKIRARRMRQDFWEFAPTHKLALLTNHKPRVRGQDHGIWRRLRMLPFEAIFDGSRADKTLPEKLKAEASGILSWAVSGCLEWQKRGLNPPAEVSQATQNYRSSQDVCGKFVVENCVIGSSNFVVKFGDLYAEMERWCKDVGERTPSKKTFGEWLQLQGFEDFQSNGRKYRAIGLKTQNLEGWNDGT